jgi:iron only hydrogenase large subunit-like protein
MLLVSKIMSIISSHMIMSTGFSKTLFHCLAMFHHVSFIPCNSMKAMEKLVHNGEAFVLE